MKKIILTLGAIFAISSSYATQVEACVISHPAGTNCYELFITITDSDPQYGSVYIASGRVWVGDDCPPSQKLNLPSPHPNCSNFLLNDEAFLTDKGSPCLQEILANPDTYSKYEAAREELLNFGNTGYRRTTKSPRSSALNNTESNQPLLSIYPNPTHNKSVIIDTRVASAQAQLKIDAYDMNGKKVYDLNLKGKEVATFELHLSQLANGTYHFVLSNNKGVLSAQKVVFQ